MIVYRHYIESSLLGEEPVHEELFDLHTDPAEARNLAADPAHRHHLERLRLAWRREIEAARGPERTVTSLPIRADS